MGLWERRSNRADINPNTVYQWVLVITSLHYDEERPIDLHVSTDVVKNVLCNY